MQYCVVKMDRLQTVWRNHVKHKISILIRQNERGFTLYTYFNNETFVLLFAGKLDKQVHAAAKKGLNTSLMDF